MRIKLNGSEREVAASTIRDLLALLGVADGRGVAVALDAEVVPRSEWGRTAVSEGQRVEILRATQGG